MPCSIISRRPLKRKYNSAAFLCVLCLFFCYVIEAITPPSPYRTPYEKKSLSATKVTEGGCGEKQKKRQQQPQCDFAKQREMKENDCAWKKDSSVENENKKLDEGAR